jgi:cell division protein FtsA
MRPLSARRTAILSVLDVGTSKIVCLIARLQPIEPSELLRGRTHRCRILGIGHQKSRGIKNGAVVDMEAAEGAIRLAVDAAERMAGVQVQSVIVNNTGGRLASNFFDATIACWKPATRMSRRAASSSIRSPPASRSAARRRSAIRAA